jgi:hypothetical protein
VFSSTPPEQAVSMREGMRYALNRKMLRVINISRNNKILHVKTQVMS